MEDFGRLWAYFCPPFARLDEDGFRRGKKKGLCPDLGRIWDAKWSRIVQEPGVWWNTLPGFRAFCPAKARPCLAKRFNTAGPPARRGTPDLARRAGSSGVPLFENSARQRDGNYNACGRREETYTVNRQAGSRRKMSSEIMKIH